MKNVTAVLILLLLFASSVGAQPEPEKTELQKKIDNAVGRGVKYLDKLLEQGFVAREHDQDNAGVGSLIGWALLEGGVAPTNPRIKRTAEQVRQYAITTFRTYSLGFTIIFLDRLGEKTDELLIQTLAVRLLEGQQRTGGWSYTSSDPPRDAEKKSLVEYYKALLENLEAAETRAAAIRQLLTVRVAAVNRTPFQALKPGQTDNSNTQVAALALWVARRHGVPVDRALQLAELRFRTSQQSDGAWSYDERPDYGRGLSMSCAGLIVTALGRATLPLDLPKYLANDPGVRNGFASVHQNMKTGLRNLSAKDIGQLSENSKIYYALWSLERTCMIYNLEKIHGVEWYEWGAAYLVDNQQEAGNWPGYFDRLHAADTCFALLFLRRANPAQDLAAKLRSKDPAKKIDFFAPIEKGRSGLNRDGGYDPFAVILPVHPRFAYVSGSPALSSVLPSRPGRGDLRSPVR